MTDVDTVLFVDAAHRDASARFDETTHTWTIGDKRARVVIASDGVLPAEFASRNEGLAQYLGVAVHGVPNYFLLTGPDTAAQKGYIAKCLAYLSHTGSTRIEVRSSTQRYFNDRSSGRTRRRGHYWRKVGRRIPSAFDVRSHDDDAADDDVFEGSATVHIDDQSHGTHVRLTGRLDPIDGHYHWQGTIFDTGLDVKLPREVIVEIDERTAAARLTERTPMAAYSVVGVGAPPFPLDEIEVEVPLL